MDNAEYQTYLDFVQQYFINIIHNNPLIVTLQLSPLCNVIRHVTFFFFLLAQQVAAALDCIF